MTRGEIIAAAASGTSLHSADLHGADLQYADLHSADLHSANLTGCEGAIAATRILPDGDIIGWKKCADGVLVKLRIPEAAKRSHAMGRKCRAEYADVLEIVGAVEARSTYDNNFIYRVGQRVTSYYPFDPGWTVECGNGIHFFITRSEAENY